MKPTPQTILFLHPSAELYGADRTLAQLLQGLDPERWRPVVALPRRGPLVELLEQAGATVEVGELGVGTRSSLSLGGLLSLAWRIPVGALRTLRLIRRHRPSLVHTNTLVMLGGALGARLSRVPHLWHVHEIIDHPRWLARLYARLLTWLADRVVCNSQTTRQSFVRWYAPLADRSVVVLNGLDEERMHAEGACREELRRELGLPLDSPVVLLVGRINAWKGQILLVEAAARLTDRFRRARFVLVGDAPAGQEQRVTELEERIAILALEEHVVHVPFREDVAAMLSAADVCVVPSTRPEPFGLVALEAMAHGRPVVAADHGGLTEVVVDGVTGLRFPPGDAEGLADALAALLGHPERAQTMGQAGRRRQRRLFTVERYRTELEQQYQELVAVPGQPAATLPEDARIIHLVPGKANPERINGVNRVVHQLATAQVRAGRDVQVWGLTPTPEAPAGPRPYPLRLFRRGRWRLRLDPVLVAAIEDLEAPVVFHLHGGLIPELALAARRLARAGHPWVFTPHGAYGPGALARRPWLKRMVIALFDRGLLAGARAVQAFSGADAQDVSRLVHPARIAVVPNGQDLPEAEVVPRRTSEARPLFGFLGRLDAHTKGLDLLIEGFARHVAEGGAGELVLVGDGPDRGALEQRVAAAGIVRRVDFAGPLFGTEKAERLAGFDALVHPSRYEGLPGTVLEAAALARPLLVSEGTHLAAEVREFEAGRVLAGDGGAELAEGLGALAELFATGDLDALGVNARRMVAERFAWSDIERVAARELYGLTADPMRRPDGVPEPGALLPADADQPLPKELRA